MQSQLSKLRRCDTRHFGRHGTSSAKARTSTQDPHKLDGVGAWADNVDVRSAYLQGSSKLAEPFLLQPLTSPPGTALRQLIVAREEAQGQASIRNSKLDRFEKQRRLVTLEYIQNYTFQNKRIGNLR